MSTDGENTDTVIAEGERVARFLADDAVKGALARLEEKYAQDWKSSTSTEEREMLWAKARVLDELQIELQAIIGNGTRAKLTRQREQRTRGQNR